jgi:predicted TIM-barrel fold metal-dependent hydrolase
MRPAERGSLKSIRTAVLERSLSALGSIQTGSDEWRPGVTDDDIDGAAHRGGVRRIDIHHHAIVPAIAALMRERNAPFVLPWSLTETWDVMAANDIEFALVSNPVPGGFLGDAPRAASFMRGANEAAAELVRDHPRSFGLLAGLPLPYVDAALDEIDRAYGQLGADGVVLIAQAGGKYLGSVEHEPVFMELNRRRATVLVHPMMLPGTPHDAQPPTVLADFLLDTTRAAISLMMNGVLDRYPDISFVLSHAGGFLPYAATRIELLGHWLYGLAPEKFRGYLHRFYYDVALSAPSALPSLLAAVPPTRILFGTDWCAAAADVVAANTRALDSSPLLDDEQRRLIDRGNALRILPRLAGAPLAGAPLAGAPLAGTR